MAEVNCDIRKCLHNDNGETCELEEVFIRDGGSLQTAICIDWED